MNNSAPSLKEVLRTPLQQAMVLLWCYGLFRLSERLLTGTVGSSWSLAALLAALASLLLAGHFGLFRAMALPMVLGLGAVLMFLTQRGIDDPVLLGTIAGGGALLCWIATCYLLRQPLIQRLAHLLHFVGKGARTRMEQGVHLCALSIALIVVALSVMSYLDGLLLHGKTRVEWLLPLLMAMALFGIAGRYYSNRWHSYLGLGTLVCAALMFFAWVWLPRHSDALGSMLWSPILGLALVILALVFWVIAALLDRQGKQPLAQSLYRKPLREVAVILALAAIGLNLYAWFHPWIGATTDAIWVLLLAGVALLLANHALDRVWCSFLGILLMTLALSGLDRLWLNGDESLRPALLLALLALGQSALADRLRHSFALQPLYEQPLYVVATLAYSGAVVILACLARPGDILLPWVLAVLCLGLFPLLRPLKQAFRWRGLGLALLLSGLLMSWVDILDMASWRWSLLMAWGYALWLLGNFLLPRCNQRWSDWAVDVMAWPWLGLLFVLWGWSEDPLTLTRFAIVSLYLFLLIRNCAWVGLPWLAVGMLLATVLVWSAWWPLVSIYWFELPTPPGSLWTLFISLNLVLLLAPGWRRYGPGLAARWSWQRHDLDIPLALLPFALLLAGLVMLTGMVIYGLLVGGSAPSFILIALLVLSLVHGFLVWPGSIQAHALLFALTLSVLAVIMPSSSGAGLALVSALWTIALLLAKRFWPWTERTEKLQQALRSWLWMMPLLVALLWLLHLAQVVWVLVGGTGVLPDGMEMSAAVAAILVLVALAIRQARRHPTQYRWVYLCAVLLGGIGVYLRLLHLGLTPPGPVDTAVLIAAAYGIFLVQRYSRSAPLYHIALILPLLALLTLPLQLASIHAGSALLAIAVLYLLMRQSTANPIPLYLGVLALNAGMYLWIPLWAQRFGLFQLYAIPAAVTVLVLLHLHRRELRPSVLNGARLGALSILYASAGLDIFLRPELSLFALALGLSIVGIVLGIALRIRIFLYTGVAFMVLTVLGQLFQFYPEQRLGRALLLISLGVVITLGMVGFSIKREAILQRVRVFRADLDQWQWVHAYSVSMVISGWFLRKYSIILCSRYSANWSR